MVVEKYHFIYSKNYINWEIPGCIVNVSFPDLRAKPESVKPPSEFQGPEKAATRPLLGERPPPSYEIPQWLYLGIFNSDEHYPPISQQAGCSCLGLRF